MQSSGLGGRCSEAGGRATSRLIRPAGRAAPHPPPTRPPAEPSRPYFPSHTIPGQNLSQTCSAAPFFALGQFVQGAAKLSLHLTRVS